MYLERFLPVYEFNELHEVSVRAPATDIFRAIKILGLADLPVMRVLLAVRSLPARLVGEGVMEVGRERSVLEEFINAGFLLLAEERDHEIVIGRIGQFWKLIGGESPKVVDPQEFAAFARPGFAKAAVNFLIEERQDGTARVSTETRVAATDRAARWKFGAYWTVIYPGSAFIRREWLRAIKRQAERGRISSD